MDFSLIWNAIVVQPMTNILLTIYGLVGNFGIAIILFTILIRLATHPLMVQQIKSSQKMQELNNSKEYKEIQVKYKDNKEKLSQEQMKLYQQMGYNPLSGCLPTLIQFPIIIGLYQSITRALAATPLAMLTLTRTIYPWLENIMPRLSLTSLIPINKYFLWMNLSQPESIHLPTLGAVIPFLEYFPILAIIVALTTYIQSKVTTPPTGNDPQSKQMSNMMSIYMPLLLGYFALNFAAGLAVYFIVSNLFGIAQYAYMGKVDWKNVLSIPFGNKAPATKAITKKNK
jgi:YidC/Oxa1 family membrane protein insertase